MTYKLTLSREERKATDCSLYIPQKPFVRVSIVGKDSFDIPARSWADAEMIAADYGRNCPVDCTVSIVWK